jgi:hypothetical protein
VDTVDGGGERQHESLGEAVRPRAARRDLHHSDVASAKTASNDAVNWPACSMAPDTAPISPEHRSPGCRLARTSPICAPADATTASDLMASSALMVIDRAGRRVPDDVAVGGFDDSPVAPASRPPLTTIRQPWDRISEMVVRQSLAQIDGEGTATVILPTELVVRESA